MEARDRAGNIIKSSFLTGKIQTISLSFGTLNKKCFNFKKIIFILLWHLKFLRNQLF